jgi:hypothetical protein
MHAPNQWKVKSVHISTCKSSHTCMCLFFQLSRDGKEIRAKTVPLNWLINANTPNQALIVEMHENEKARPVYCDGGRIRHTAKLYIS